MTEETPIINYEEIDYKTLPLQIRKEIDMHFPRVKSSKLESEILPLYLMIDGLPTVPAKDEEKLDKLKKFLKKKIRKETTVKVDKIYFLPDGEVYPGYGFLEVATPEDARLVLTELDGKKMDKKHTFRVNTFEQFNEIMNYELEEYRNQEFPPYREAEDNYSWLHNPDGLDQFVVRYDAETEVFWNMKSEATPVSEIRRQNWTRDFVQWSPTGRYLIVKNDHRVDLFGGPNWTLQKSFDIENVELVSFSPCETFMVTLSFFPPKTREFNESLVIWDVVSQAPAKKFKPIIDQDDAVWPAFEWSFDDKYCSRLHKGFILVYITESFQLLNNQPIKLHGPCFNHQWSPTDGYMAVFVPDFKNMPAKISLYKMPQLRVVAQCSSIGIENCMMHWQESGDFLAVKVDRIQKKKLVHLFELFSIREKDIPVESFNVDNRLHAFAWEPVGNKFAIIHSEVEEDTRPNVTFYELTNRGVKELYTLTKQAVNTLFWAPNGRFICLAGLGNLNGQIVFSDTETGDITCETQHSMCTQVTWDPTGRYVATIADVQKGRSENGYRLWSFHGNELLEERKQSLYQFLWRPRPKNILPKDKIEWLKVPKNFKQFRLKYRKEDRQFRDEFGSQRAEERREIRNNYARYFMEHSDVIEKDAQKLKQLNIDVLSSANEEFEFQVLESKEYFLE